MNYSNNEIEEIGDLSPHHSLQTLILDGKNVHSVMNITSIGPTKWCILNRKLDTGKMTDCLSFYGKISHQCPVLPPSVG